MHGFGIERMVMIDYGGDTGLGLCPVISLERNSTLFRCGVTEMAWAILYVQYDEIFVRIACHLNV